MAAALIWTEPALADLEELADYIAVENPEAASRLVQRILRHVEQLAHFPESGPPIPELLPETRHRQIVERPCRIFYRHDAARRRVYILAVRRGERNFDAGALGRGG